MLKSRSLSDEAKQVRNFEVVEYMSNMNGEHHPVLSGGPIYDSLKGQWRAPPDKKDLNDLYSECRNAQVSLTARVNKYLQKTKQPPLQLECDGDWRGVNSRVERACVVIDKVLKARTKKPGFASALRRGYDTFCRNAGTGKALLSVIPDDLMIASAVCGGLNVIFTALEAHAVYEESVFKALAGLPEILNTHERYSDIAVNDLEIHRRTAGLYARVCEALEYILRWMMDNVLISGAKQFFQPKRYAQDLNDKMAEVKRAAQALEQWASIVLLESQKDVIAFQSGIYAQQTQLGRQFEGLHSKLDRQDEERHEQSSKLKDSLERINRLEQIIPVVYKDLQQMFNDGWSRAYRNHEMAKQGTMYQIESPPATPSAEDVLKALMYDPNLVPNDADSILRHGTASLRKMIEPRRVLAVQNNPRVKAWISHDSSSILLINGNATTHLDMSTSFISARIFRTLSEQGEKGFRLQRSLKVIPLAYFCSQHQSYSQDEAASPSELAMSLLLQLLDWHRDFDDLDLRHCLEGTDAYNVGSILSSLGRLLSHLTLEAIVYLVVDGVEHFARPDARRHQFQDVLLRLVNIFRLHKGAKLKILFTSIQRSVLIERLGLLEDDEIVDIPNSPPTTNVWNYEKTILTMGSGS